LKIDLTSETFTLQIQWTSWRGKIHNILCANENSLWSVESQNENWG